MVVVGPAPFPSHPPPPVPHGQPHHRRPPNPPTPVLANFAHDLDSTFPTLRTNESNAANFVADAVRDVTGADIVLINGGTLRSDMVHKAGPFRLRDLLRMLPFPDEVSA